MTARNNYIYYLFQPVGTNVPGGDPGKEVTLKSTQRDSFLPQTPGTLNYNRGDTMGRILKTNFNQHDGHGKFDTYISTASEAYRPTEGKGWQHECYFMMQLYSPQ